MANSSKKNNIKSTWFSHLKGETERQEFKEYLASSAGVLERLDSIINEKLDSKKVFKEEDYKSNSWAYQQADRNGYMRALLEIKNLL